MKNETYNYDINRLLHILGIYKVEHIKENKYKYITLNVKVFTNSSGGYSSPNIYVKNNNENILNTKYDYEEDFENATFNYKSHLIPKKRYY